MKKRYQIDQQRAVQQFRQLAREENPVKLIIANFLLDNVNNQVLEFARCFTRAIIGITSN